MKYAFIQQHSREFCIPRLCQALGVARSSYYEWLERQFKPQQREQRRTMLDTRVATAFQLKKSCDGAWRLHQLLTKDGCIWLLLLTYFPVK